MACPLPTTAIMRGTAGGHLSSTTPGSIFSELSAKLFASSDKARKHWIARCLDRLDRGQIEVLVKILRDPQPATDEFAKTVTDEAEYFERNADRMHYPPFRAQGLFVGSGVVEAGCKIGIGSRLMCSGMFWTVRGTNAIIALRCCRLSRRFEDYWADRSRAARSSTLQKLPPVQRHFRRLDPW